MRWVVSVEKWTVGGWVGALPHALQPQLELVMAVCRKEGRNTKSRCGWVT